MTAQLLHCLSHYSGNPSRLLKQAGLYSIICFSIFLVQCDSSPTDSTDCQNIPVGSHLTEVFYWGKTESDTWQPLQGKHVGAGRFATWIGDTTFAISTQRRVRGVVLDGIATVTLTSGLEFREVQFFQFANRVFQIEYLADQDALAVLYQNSGTSSPAVGTIDLMADSAAVSQVLVASDQNCEGIAAWMGHAGIIAYSRRADIFASGFYWYSASDSDSLLQATILNVAATRKFGVSRSGDYLYYAAYQVGADGSNSTLLMKKDLKTVPSYPIVEMILSGRVVSIDVHPMNDNVLVVHADDVRDRVMIVDVTTKGVEEVDVRTSADPCVDVYSEFPRWSNDGGAGLLRSWTSRQSEGKIWAVDL